MKIQFLLFQDEEDAPDNRLIFDLPGVPQTGDVVTISRPGQEGYTNFVVRRTQWDLDHPDDKPGHRIDKAVVGKANAVTVECVYIVGPYSSEEHKTIAPVTPETRR